MKTKYLLLIAVCGTIVALDQLTKNLVHTQFNVGESLKIIPGFFNLTYIRNPGAAFGFLANSHELFRENFFLILPPVAMMAILYVLRTVEETDRLQSLALSLVFGGALGNYIDRLRFRFVIDFIDLHIYEKFVWPAFNIADSAIVVGIAIVLLQSFMERKELSKSEKLTTR